MEVSFTKEVEQLRLSEGEVFRGEGILAVTKALLQSGVSYVGGYQGAPISHLLDVMVQAEGLMNELGVKVEAATSEAAAAAMLGASIGYPLRGAATWKSIVGTNVASDALSNLSSAGVTGGALIILGEDYGEGASVIQERSHAFALKSTIWLLDPKPNLPTMVRMVEKGFELSEASNTPVMMELRIRACHVTGEFVARDNRAPLHALGHLLEAAAFDYSRLSHPPATFVQEKDKVDRRLPAARAFVQEQGLNEFVGGDLVDIGIILQGGLYNAVIGRLQQLGLADTFGASRVPLLILNVVHPLVPEEITKFCDGKQSVLVVEEGAPAFIEQAIAALLRNSAPQLSGKNVLPEAGEYTAEVLESGLTAFLGQAGVVAPKMSNTLASGVSARDKARQLLGNKLPERPPTFCVGCPERPVFTALKLLQRETGAVHVAADIGCHALATFAPFDSGNTILGYGMSLASASALSSFQKVPPIAVMGDGGFWHNGLISGVANAAFNKDNTVLVVLNNGYSSATGVQAIPSTRKGDARRGLGLDIASAAKAVGARWIRRVRTYDVSGVLRTLREATQSRDNGLKVIVANGECQLSRQRRERGAILSRRKTGKRVVRVRYGIDDNVCTGDHSCIRLSGCPSLTLKPSRDALRTDPVAHVNNDCVGCGLCGEVAHAAQLCPSFYRAEVISNPTIWDRVVAAIRTTVIGRLASKEPA